MAVLSVIEAKLKANTEVTEKLVAGVTALGQTFSAEVAQINATIEALKVANGPEGDFAPFIAQLESNTTNLTAALESIASLQGAVAAVVPDEVPPAA